MLGNTCGGLNHKSGVTRSGALKATVSPTGNLRGGSAGVRGVLSASLGAQGLGSALSPLSHPPQGMQVGPEGQLSGQTTISSLTPVPPRKRSARVSHGDIRTMTKGQRTPFCQEDGVLFCLSGRPGSHFSPFPLRDGSIHQKRIFLKMIVSFNT